MHTKRHFGSNDPNFFKKGVYSYEYATGPEILTKTRNGPPRIWNCALKISEAELELITDPETFLFFENAIRGGISTISHQYAKTNNKYLANYDPDLQSEFLIYLDANNLYGYALSQTLPVG